MATSLVQNPVDAFQHRCQCVGVGGEQARAKVTLRLLSGQDASVPFQDPWLWAGSRFGPGVEHLRNTSKETHISLLWMEQLWNS